MIKKRSDRILAPTDAEIEAELVRTEELIAKGKTFNLRIPLRVMREYVFRKHKQMKKELEEIAKRRNKIEGIGGYPKSNGSSPFSVANKRST